MIEAWGEALERKDPGTWGHCKRVAAFATILAQALKLDDEAVRIVAEGALLHEIGKLAIPEAILRKPAKLTQEEMLVMRESSSRGYEILRNVASYAEAAVFPSPNKGSRSGHSSLSAVEHQFKDARTKAKLPKELVLYCARHTYATDALARTGNLAAVMDTMGHASVQTTMIYQHQGLEQIRNAINVRNTENKKIQSKAVRVAKKLVGQSFGQSPGNGVPTRMVSD